MVGKLLSILFGKSLDSKKGAKMKIAVLGAGVSGLTAARLLTDSGHEVVVFEKNHTIGGLARTRHVNGRLYDPHGGHIFNSKHPEVTDWVFSMLPKETWKYTERNAKIYFNGKYISYPFELSLCELDVDDAVECTYDFMHTQIGAEPDNFRDWLTWKFGKSIANYYMIPYNEKIWAYPLEQMEIQWVSGKMPLPSQKDILRSMLLKNPRERKMPHSTFYYPLNGGIQTMVNSMAEGVQIQTDYTVKRIKNNKGGWIINDDGPFDLVISTIPLPVLPSVMDLPSDVLKSMKGLKYNSLTTVLFDCPETDISWLYIPSHEYRSHRVCYQSSMTPNATNIVNKGCGAIEIIGDRFNVDDSFCKRKDILPEELDFREALDFEFTEYAYVIHDLDYRKNLKSIFDYFAKVPSFRLLGRWGTWNYKNMDLCMLDAMELVNGLNC